MSHIEFEDIEPIDTTALDIDTTDILLLTASILLLLLLFRSLR